MSLVVILKPGMSGYEKHRMDYLISNYNGEYGYRRIRLTDTEFARYVCEQTGVHIDLGSRLEARKGQSGACSSYVRCKNEPIDLMFFGRLHQYLKDDVYLSEVSDGFGMMIFAEKKKVPDAL